MDGITIEDVKKCMAIARKSIIDTVKVCFDNNPHDIEIAKVVIECYDKDLWVRLLLNERDKDDNRSA